MYIMELDFGNSVSSNRLLDQIAAKKSDTADNLFTTWVNAQNSAKDSITINTFKEITVDYLRDKIGTRKFNCTFTLTLDLSKRGLHSLINDHIEQWRHLKQQMRAHMGTYRYRYYMIPEYTRRGVVHAHGIICFNSPTYDDYQYDRSRWVRKMKLKVGKCLQWTRINDLYQSYMPTESNVTVRRNQTFSNWIDNYCHKTNLRKNLGHSNMME